tara:strand:- start:157 stop:492 length:336 start_codon:yes stop_codon:yes gene_type:complete
MNIFKYAFIINDKMKKNFFYTLICLLTLSCTTVLEGTYTWDEFIEERSGNGDFFFAEATAPDGSVSFGSSNDSQWGANNMATRHCSENSGKICRITQTRTLPRKGNLLGIF